jgi:hypothetical protein
VSQQSLSNPSIERDVGRKTLKQRGGEVWVGHFRSRAKAAATCRANTTCHAMTGYEFIRVKPPYLFWGSYISAEVLQNREIV